MNRNRSIVIDFKHENGVEIMKNLSKDSTIIIENYRTGVMEKLGLGYEDLKKSILKSYIVQYQDSEELDLMPNEEVLISLHRVWWPDEYNRNTKLTTYQGWCPHNRYECWNVCYLFNTFSLYTC